MGGADRGDHGGELGGDAGLSGRRRLDWFRFVQREKLYGRPTARGAYRCLYGQHRARRIIRSSNECSDDDNVMQIICPC